MTQAGVDPTAIEVFSHYDRLLEHGETGMIPESAIDPLDMESIDDVEVPDEDATEAIRGTVVIKLNGGLGTSMGMDRARARTSSAPRKMPGKASTLLIWFG